MNTRTLSIVVLGIAALQTALDQTAGGGQENPPVSAQEGVVGEKVPVINFQVLEQRKINLGNRSLFLNRVVPPVLPELPPPPVPGPPPTAEQIAEWEARQPPQKKQGFLFLSTTVYDRKVTEIRRFENQREYQMFSNIDFNYLAGLGWFETADTEYMLLMGTGNETAEQVEGFNQYARENGWPERSHMQIPAPETFSLTRSEYVVVEDERHLSPPAEELAALDALHVYFDANRQRLEEEYAKRESARIERERWLKKHPPVPKDTVINYWVGEGGTGTGILDKRSIAGRP